MEKQGLLAENVPIDDRRRFLRSLGCQFWSVVLVLSWIVVLCCITQDSKRKAQPVNPVFVSTHTGHAFDMHSLIGAGQCRKFISVPDLRPDLFRDCVCGKKQIVNVL